MHSASYHLVYHVLRLFSTVVYTYEFVALIVSFIIIYITRIIIPKTKSIFKLDYNEDCTYMHYILYILESKRNFCARQI